MGTLKEWLFGKSPKPPPLPQPQTNLSEMTDEDRIYLENQDIMAPPEFIVTLQITTPSAVLVHHGERFNGAPSRAPRYATIAEGIWVMRAKSWAELGAKGFKEKESEMASDVGPILASTYLPFLLSFRHIVEGGGATSEKIEDLHHLSQENPTYSKIWKRLKMTYHDFPESFFYLQFTSVSGIGPKTARALYSAGYRSVDEIISASAENLSSVPGIGPKLISKIRKTNQTTG